MLFEMENNRNPTEPGLSCKVTKLDGHQCLPEYNGNSCLRAEQYCRLCGLEVHSGDLINIHGDQGSQLELQKKIKTYLQLKVEKDDLLPQQVCNICVNNLNTCQKFFDTSHAADSRLRQFFLFHQVMEDFSPKRNDLVISQDQDNADFCIAGELETDRNKAGEETSVETGKKSRTPASLLCHICGKHFKNPANLQAHKRTHLAESLKKKYRCSLCPKSFRSKFHLSEHLNVHNGVTPYTCPNCAKPFHKRAQLRQHSLIHIHESKKLSCEVCGLRFNRKSNLQAHSKIHAENRTFACRLCQKRFPSFSSMLSHRKQHSQEDIKNRLDLDLIVNKEQIFTCEVCGKILTNKDSLISHLEQHKPGGSVTKYECKVCGKVLRSRHSLAYHQRSQHSGDRPFHCSFCSDGFMTQKLLQAHERRHTGEKPFKCETCWKCFRSRNNLTQHLLKHSGEKNFECLICGKKFFRKGALTVHNRKHTGEKPFICDLCGRPFRQKNDMLKHQKTHTESNTQTCTCELCMVVFNSRKELLVHKDIAHKTADDIVPLIITNNMFETHIITEDGQKIVFTTVDTLDNNNVTDLSLNVP